MLAVITGASSGIGTEFARKLAARKYALLLVARREDRLRSLAQDLKELYRVDVEILAADLTSPPDREIVARRIQDVPGLALLVNNAGFGSTGYFYETEIRRQMEMHELHVLATARLCHAAVQNPSLQGIINVSSVAAFAASPQSVSYGATKRWMNGFSEALALEMQVTSRNVKVQALCPGFTLTEFHDQLNLDHGGVPKSLWMTADFVVRESLKGYDQGRVIVVPGWRYKGLVALLKIVPESLVRWGTVQTVKRYRRRKKS
jgi:short-subunit dehydrogenase